MEKNENRKKYLELLALEIIFVMVAFLTGPILDSDSMEYITGSYYRAGLYPVFLSFCSYLGGLYTVIVVQSMFVAFSIWLLSNYLIEKIATKTNYGIKLLVYGSVFFTIEFINIGIGIDAWHPSTVSTESFSYSLYFCFLYFIFQYFESKKIKYILLSFLPMIVCVLMREQTIILIFAVLAYCSIMYGLNLKKIAICVCGFILVLLTSSVLKNIYVSVNHFRNDVSDIDANFITEFIYISDEDDKYILEDDERVLFQYAYTANKEMDYLYTIMERDNGRIMADFSRDIAFIPMCYHLRYGGNLENYIEYLSEKYSFSYYEGLKMFKRNIISMDIKLVLNHPVRFINSYIFRVLHAMIRTIIPHPGFFNNKPMLEYIYLICGMAIYGINFYVTEASKNILLKNISRCIFVSTFFDACVISIFHSVEPRYYAYGTGLFYLLLIYNIWLAIKKGYR